MSWIWWCGVRVWRGRYQKEHLGVWDHVSLDGDALTKMESPRRGPMVSLTQPLTHLVLACRSAQGPLEVPLLPPSPWLTHKPLVWQSTGHVMSSSPSGGTWHCQTMWPWCFNFCHSVLCLLTFGDGDGGGVKERLIIKIKELKGASTWQKHVEELHDQSIIKCWNWEET